jgi:broad specificity phosphatase PhoE
MRRGVDCIVALVKRASPCILALAVLFCGAHRSHAQEAVYVVRHGERADQSTNSPLSGAGAARARKLAGMLKDAGITHVFTTTLTRTIDTAAPLAELVHAQVEQLAPADTPGLTAKLAALGANDRVLVVGHSNTVPELLRALRVATPVTIAEDEFDNLFVVVPRPNSPPAMLRLKY